VRAPRLARGLSSWLPERLRELTALATAHPALLGATPVSEGRGTALSVDWGARTPLSAAMLIAEAEGSPGDALADGVIAVCAGAARSLAHLAGAGLHAGGLFPHQIALDPSGEVSIDVASGWLRSADHSSGAEVSPGEDGALLMELAAALMSGGSPWTELAARVLDRGDLIDPAVRRGGVRALAPLLAELAGTDLPGEQARRVRAAFPFLR